MENGLFRLEYTNKADGNLLMFAHYTDSSLNTLEGSYSIFYKDGKTKETGNYTADKKNGVWQEWDMYGRKMDSIFYKNDNVIVKVIYTYYNNGIPAYYSLNDGLMDTLATVSYDEKGAIKNRVFFKGTLGVSKRYESGVFKSQDSLFTRDQFEAYFPGANNAWIRYLQLNLDPLTPVKRGAPAGTYQVIVKFIVTKEGKIKNVKAETNRGYGMEDQVINMIRRGPDWVPATQYGLKVEAYRRQPVTFVVEAQ